MTTKEIIRMNWNNLVRLGEEEMKVAETVEDDVLEELFETGRWRMDDKSKRPAHSSTLRHHFANSAADWFMGWLRAQH